MDEKTLAKINRKFNARKQNRDALLSLRREEIYARLPRIREIDDAIFGGGMRMLSSVWEGTVTPEESAARYADEIGKLTAEKSALLRGAGYKADYLDPPYTCPHCKDTGLQEGALCSCYLSLLSEELAAESGMGNLLKKQTFSAFDLEKYSDKKAPGETISPRKNMQTILSVCQSFVRDFKTRTDNLLFYGNPGLGKTFLSSAIANALLEKGVSVLYQSAAGITDILSDARFKHGESETGAFLKEQLLKTDLLIIDDLGTEFINSMTDADIFYIVNSRILAEKSTIISTNLSLPDIGRVYSDRMLSRIMGHYKPIHFYGTDIRSMQ